MKDDAMNKNNRAIALVRAQFTNPVVLPQMGRKEFDDFLHDKFGRPDDDVWKRPSGAEELKDDEDFYLVEYFNTPTGSLMAAHISDFPQPVIVVMDGPVNQVSVAAK
ncbi:hypothetical protein [Cypionkella psychrotolerans]|uniref:hypothetical protein n=1 Tax=Cypionkella psychrotolerans TaxID=1678131 RepID=UPI0006B423E7|nr:hypothetical protein [Cypionkella psychrotolerans]